MRTELLLTLLIPALFASPGSASAQTGAGEPNDTRCHVDTTKVVTLPFEWFLVQDHKVEPATTPPTTEDMERAECMLNDRLAQWNENEAYSKEARITESFRYYRQYCALQDSTGHRLIYLNAFCGSWHLDSWKHRWVEVDDGGSCFFQALFDLTSRRLLLFSVNGMG